VTIAYCANAWLVRHENHGGTSGASQEDEFLKDETTVLSIE
jgi:hypothetical protein